MKTLPTLALAGNPNTGKTTLFNRLTGSTQRVGNWAGVTVEKKEGFLTLGEQFPQCHMIDLPGVYGLTTFSKEETVTRDYLVNECPDLILQVLDANNLERNLYLTLQLAALQRPMVLAINMMDELRQKQATLNTTLLSNLLGIPVVPISASKSEGLDELAHTLNNSLLAPTVPPPFYFPPNIETALSNVMSELKALDQNSITALNPYPARWLASKVLEHDPVFLSLTGLKAPAPPPSDDDWESQMILAQYSYLENLLPKVLISNAPVKNDRHVDASNWTLALDKVLTNRWIGIPIFGMMMYLVFWLTFSIGGIFLDWIDAFFSQTLALAVANALDQAGVADFMISLVVDGVIGGVGAVLTFLPNILMLFVAMAFLEDTGYMARVAYIMDRLMSRLGLNGKAIVPLIMGFGCNTPAILGTRILEHDKDRLIAILINPFMSCGARLPIYVLLSSAFFPGHESMVTFSLYLLGMLVAIGSALLFKTTLLRGTASPFLLELPPYRWPSWPGILTKVGQHGRAYLTRAGTVIFVASMIIWFLLSFGPQGFTSIENSFGRLIGSSLSPFFSLMGFGNWQASLSLLTGIVAKEIVITNMSIIYGMGSFDSGVVTSGFQEGLTHLFTPLSAYAFMVFSLLYTPCIAVIAVMKSETRSWRWPLFSIVYTLLVAWLAGTLVYQIGTLFLNVI